MESNYITVGDLIEKLKDYDKNIVITIYDDTTDIYDTIKNIKLEKNAKKYSEEDCDYKKSDIVVITTNWDYYEK